MAEKLKSNLGFTLDTKKIVDVLKLATSVVPVQDGSNFIASAANNELWLYCFNETASARFLLETEEVIGTGELGLNILGFQNLLKGRAQLVFTKENSVMKFKALKGAYNGELVSLPVDKGAFENVQSLLSFDKSARKQSTKIDEDTLSSIKEGMTYTSLNPIHVSDPLETFIKIAKGKVEITVCDSFHMALYERKVATDISLQLSVPKTHFDIFARAGAEYQQAKKPSSIFMDADLIKVNHPCYSIALPATQTKDSTFTKVKTFMKELPKATAAFSTKKSELVKVLSNLQSVYEEGSYVCASLIKKKDKEAVQLATKTLHGSVSDTLTVSEFTGKQFAANIDPRMLRDFMGAAPTDALDFEIIADTAVVARYTDEEYKVVYVSSLVGD
jgi:hypothetical protein